jgi:transcriptional regulator with XRE-family HTH domain
MAEPSLKNLRELSGLTQQQIARVVGVDRSNLSMIESGVLKTDESTKTRIRRVLIRALVARRARIDSVLVASRILASNEPAA